MIPTDEMIREGEKQVFTSGLNGCLFDMEIDYFLIALQKEQEHETRLIGKKQYCIRSFFDTLTLLEEISYENMFWSLLFILEYYQMKMDKQAKKPFITT